MIKTDNEILDIVNDPNNYEDVEKKSILSFILELIVWAIFTSILLFFCYNLILSASDDRIQIIDAFFYWSIISSVFIIFLSYPLIFLALFFLILPILSLFYIIYIILLSWDYLLIIYPIIPLILIIYLVKMNWKKFLSDFKEFNNKKFI